jgi:hypothetical protein
MEDWPQFAPPQQPTPPVSVPQPEQPQQEETSLKHFLLSLKESFSHNKTVFIIFIVAFLVLLSGTVYLFFSPATQTPPPLAQLPSPTLLPTATLIPPPTATTTPLPATPTKPPMPTPTPDPTIGWKTYTNTQYGYTIKYPPDWQATDRGALEPLVPSYIVFNPNTASASARSITASISTRTLQQQIAIGGTTGVDVAVGGAAGTLQNLQDSDGSKSISIIFSRPNHLLIIHSKEAYNTTFGQMMLTLHITQ